MYELVDLRKVFPGDVVALDGVSLAVEPGEHVALIGPSGAGKTTLFRLLNLTLRPTGGSIRLDGDDAAVLAGPRLRAARRRVGTIYQQHHLVGRLRVVHNVLAGNLGRWSTARALASLVRPADVDRAAAVLDRVGIGDKLWTRTDELSGGQQQRVAIARLLVQDPDVILADEPVSSVDPSLAASIVSMLCDLSVEGGKTLLVNLHSVELALRFFPRVVGVRDGRIAFDRPASEVGPDLLEGLYDGGPAVRGEERRDDARYPFGRACGPLPDFPK